MAATVTTTDPDAAQFKLISSAPRPFLEKMMRNWRTAAEAVSDFQSKAIEDQNFRVAEQWDPKHRQDREDDGRPCLTINRIPQFITQVTSAQRASRPAIQVDPIDSSADPKTAEALQGVIRTIETNSDADIVYSTGCDQQVTTGFGAWRVNVEYAPDDSYEQILALRRIINPLSTYIDPAAVEADRSDARFCFFIEHMPEDEFVERFGEEALAGHNEWMGMRDSALDWMPEGAVQVGEYYYKEFKSVKMVRVEMPNDKGGPKDTKVIPASTFTGPDAVTMPDTWRKVEEFEVEQVIVKWARVIPSAVLEGNKAKTAGAIWPSRYLPLIPCIGKEFSVNGKTDIRGLVRDARDPQRMYNFWASALTEQIALSPRAPYIGYAGQFKGFEEKWNQANRQNYAYLEVNAVTIAGQPAPLPQRTQFSPAIEAIVEAFQLADNDLKSVTGFYDASLGKSGPEQSGKAILARQHAGEMGSSDYLDNVSRAIRHTGRVLLDMIPRIYGPKRIMRIIGEDNKSKMIAIHTGVNDTTDLEALQGIAGIYDISVGRYDVSITTGPSYASRRQEAVASMLELIRAYPQALPMIGDLVAANMDWPGAAEVAARLRRAVPPNLLQDGPQITPEAYQQLKAAFDELSKKMQTKQAEIASKEKIAAAEIASKERTTVYAAEATMAIAAAKGDAARMDKLIDVEQARMDAHLDRAHEVALGAADAAHEVGLGAADADHAQGIQSADHAHAATQADADRAHELALSATESPVPPVQE